MITVVGDGNDGHRIEDAQGTLIGSLRNGTIRLTGFASDREALDAVPTLWAVLDAALARQYAGWRRYRPTGALRLAHDGAHLWATDGRRPLARVVRGDVRALTCVAALEFVLPSYATDGALIAAATVLVRALERHREAAAPASSVMRPRPAVPAPDLRDHADGDL